MKFESDLDLDKISRLINALLEEGTTSQLNTNLTVRSQFAYDTTINRIKFYDGAGIKTILLTDDIVNTVYGPSWIGVTDKTASLDVLHTVISATVAPVTASNGLTRTGANIAIGGPLTVNTSITGANKTLEIGNDSSRLSSLYSVAANDISFKTQDAAAAAYQSQIDLSNTSAVLFFQNLSTNKTSALNLNDLFSLWQWNGVGSGLSSITLDTNGVGLKSGSAFKGYFKTTNLTADRNYELPNTSGTFALLSDLPIITASNGLTLTSSNIELGGPLLSDIFIDGTYAINIGTITPLTEFVLQNTTLTEITTISGTQTQAFVLSAGVGQLITTDSGTGITSQFGVGSLASAFSWDNGSTIGSFVYADTNGIGISTNYPIPNFAYLRTDNLTANRTYQFPDASGTLSLTSDLSAYLPLSGGTMSGNINMGVHDITSVKKLISSGGDQIWFTGTGINISAATGDINISGLANININGSELHLQPDNVLKISGSNTSQFVTLNTSALTTGRTVNFPDASGTFALTSNLSAYLALAGGTMTGNINFASNAIMTGSSVSGPVTYTNQISLSDNPETGGGDHGMRLSSTNSIFTTTSSYIRIGETISSRVTDSSTGVHSATIGNSTSYSIFAYDGTTYQGAVKVHPTFVSVSANNASFYNANLATSLLTADRSFEFPDASGTFALLSDLVPLSQNLVFKIKNSNYQVLPTDEIILVDTSGGDVNITLPLPGSLTVRNNFTIKKITSDVNVVNIIQANSIDGVGTFIISTYNRSVTPAYEGITNNTWYII